MSDVRAAGTLPLASSAGRSSVCASGIRRRLSMTALTAAIKKRFRMFAVIPAIDMPT
jgi:hypothetical protein